MGATIDLDMMLDLLADKLAERLARRPVANDPPPVPTSAPALSASKEWLTVSDVATELAVAEPTVRAWIKSGALTASRVGVGGSASRLWRVRRTDLSAFVSKRSGAPPQDLDTQALAIVRKIGSR